MKLKEKKNSNFLSNKNNTFKFQLKFHNPIIQFKKKESDKN